MSPKDEQRILELSLLARDVHHPRHHDILAELSHLLRWSDAKRRSGEIIARSRLNSIMAACLVIGEVTYAAE